MAKQQRVVILVDQHSFLLDGDPDASKYTRGAWGEPHFTGHALPALLRDGWTVESITGIGVSPTYATIRPLAHAYAVLTKE